jgi:hypothetical protein
MSELPNGSALAPPGDGCHPPAPGITVGHALCGCRSSAAGPYRAYRPSHHPTIDCAMWSRLSARAAQQVGKGSFYETNLAVLVLATGHLIHALSRNMFP